MKVREQLAAKLGTQTWHDIAPHCHGNFIRRGEITANLQANLAVEVTLLAKQAEYFLRLLRLASLAN